MRLTRPKRKGDKRWDVRCQGPSGVNSVQKPKKSTYYLSNQVFYLFIRAAPLLLPSSSCSEESHNDLESAPAAAAIVCAGCTPDSLIQLLCLGGGGGGVGDDGRVECYSQRGEVGGKKGEGKRHTHIYMYTFLHIHKSCH